MVRILVILGMLVGFLVTMSVALLVAVHFIDWNAQRSWVANRLSDALARPVSIERGLDIALFPSPHIVVRDLMVGTSFADAGFALAKIGHGELRLDLPQLLKGKIEFSSVRLSEVTLNVPAKGQLSRLTFLPVQEVELRSVTIVLPGQGRPSLLISQGLMSWPPEATRGEVKLVGTVSGERVMASGSVGWRMDGDSDPLAVVDLSIGVAATTTTINGVVGHNKMDLALESQTPAFEQLLAWFEWLPSASMRSQLAGSARLKGQLTGPLSAGPRLEINEFEVQLSQVRGTFQGDIFFKSEERDWSAVLEMTASTQDISQFPGHGALWDHFAGPAALQSMVFPERLLYGMKISVGSDTLDRHDFSPIRRHRQIGTRLDGPSFHQDGAGTAAAGVTANMSPLQPYRLPQKVHQEHPRFDLALVWLTIDRDGDRAFRHGRVRLPPRRLFSRQPQRPGVAVRRPGGACNPPNLGYRRKDPIPLKPLRSPL